MNLIITIITLIWIIVIPAAKNAAHNHKKKSARARRRDPRNYGAVTLDGQTISVRGKGLLDPEALYTRTEH